MTEKYTKAHAARVAAEERAELGYSPFEAMDPHRLAENHGIRVLTLADLTQHEEALTAAVDHFTLTRPDVFSGALLPLSTGQLILVNHTHSPERQRSTLAHELGHVLLEHAFTTTLHLTGRSGKCRQSDQSQEIQANELGGELLIPRKAAFQAARDGHSDEQVARAFQVSLPFALAHERHRRPPRSELRPSQSRTSLKRPEAAASLKVVLGAGEVAGLQTPQPPTRRRGRPSVEPVGTALVAGSTGTTLAHVL